jgi:hypothetical protein
MNGTTTSKTPSRSGSDAERKPTDEHCGCDFGIRIECRGDVHIHNHCAPAGDKGGGGEPTPPAGCTPPAGSCLAPIAGAKHKRSREQKLAALAERVRVPSALAASSLQLLRRHLAGKAPANTLESAAFATLNRMAPAMRDVLACAVDAFDHLPQGQRATLFAPALTFADADSPIDPAALAQAWRAEILGRAGVLAFGDPQGANEERPGRIRVYEPQGEDFFSQVRICRVNDLRTANFIPPLSAGDFTPEELQQDCSPQLVNGQVQVVCALRTSDCPGNTLANACARVPDIVGGAGVVLSGVNYFSTDAKVRLTARAPGTATRDVDAHVFGDVDTPVTEVVEGQTRLVNDCRVHDVISFQVPDDLPPAIYEMRVIVPNITGIAALGDHLESNSEFINVTPSPTARFQIASELLICREETSPGWIGSDEVGLNIVAVALLPDLSTDVPQTNRARFDDVDSGENRSLARVLFAHNAPVIAVALSVLGHEVDGEDAYNQMITSSTDIFVDLVKDQAAFIKSALAAAGGAAALGKLGVVGAIIVAVAAALTLAIDLIIALWAPADLIIEDPTGYTLDDLIARTSANFGAPPAASFKTEGDITVNVTPLDKLPLQYRERREYVSDDEDSRYEIVYRFNRVA